MLSPAEKIRYDRQILIPGFGIRGQLKLQKAKLFIAGCGGLGTPVALYLAAAGIGTLRIVDNDSVELSNLNRQILHWERDLGTKKVVSANKKLKKINSFIKLDMKYDTISADNAASLTRGFDVIVDAMDNLPTRFVLNDAALKNGIPFVHGAVYGMEGRVTTIIPNLTACLSCLYRGVPPKKKFPVLGTTPGIIGMIQATETIKLITGTGQPLANRLLMYDGLAAEFTEIKIKRTPDCVRCGISKKE